MNHIPNHARSRLRKVTVHLWSVHVATMWVFFSFSVTILAGPEPALYRTVDLKTGEVTETGAPPPDLLSNSLYKTSKMVFRRIPAGTVMMNEGRLSSTLGHDYWLGVFECTQAQWETVMGNNPSRYPGPERPVEQVPFEGVPKKGFTIRGGTWPKGEPDSLSFMAKLRTICGGKYKFDLPTESQWEYAARAGTTAEINTGKNLTASFECPNLGEAARYAGDLNDGRGGFTQHTTVGSYAPNAWGLYDMQGNVWEWCLDWCWTLPKEPVTDYPGLPQNVSGRSIRGGSWRDSAWFSVVGVRNDANHKHTASSSIGFRVCIQP